MKEPTVSDVLLIVELYKQTCRTNVINDSTFKV